MRDAENIQQVIALGVNMIGLIFWPKSPRYHARGSARGMPHSMTSLFARTHPMPTTTNSTIFSCMVTNHQYT